MLQVKYVLTKTSAVKLNIIYAYLLIHNNVIFSNKYSNITVRQNNYIFPLQTNT